MWNVFKSDENGAKMLQERRPSEMQWKILNNEAVNHYQSNYGSEVEKVYPELQRTWRGWGPNT